MPRTQIDPLAIDYTALDEAFRDFDEWLNEEEGNEDDTADGRRDRS